MLRFLLVSFISCSFISWAEDKATGQFLDGLIEGQLLFNQQTRADKFALEYLLSEGEDLNKIYQAFEGMSRDANRFWLESEEYQRLKKLGKDQSKIDIPSLMKTLPEKWRPVKYEGKNSFEQFKKFAEADFINKPPVDLEGALWKIRGGEKLDVGEIEKLKEYYTEVFPTAEKGFKVLTSAPFKVNILESDNFDYGYLSTLRAMTRIYANTAKVSYLKGNMKLMNQCLQKARKLADISLQSEGNLVDMLVGVACQGISDRANLWLSRQKRLDPKLLNQLFKNINPDALSIELVNGFLRGESLYTVKMVSEFCTDRPAVFMKQLGALYILDRSSYVKKIKERTLLQKEKLIQEQVQMYRLILTQYDEIPKESVPKARNEILKRVEVILKEEDNWLGNYLLSNVIPSVSSVAWKYYESKSKSHAIQLAIAIRVYEQKFKELPESLDDLVIRGVLKKLPKNDWNAKPFVYKPNSRVIEIEYFRGETEIDF